MSFLDIITAAAEGGDVNALRSQLAPAISEGLSEGLSGASMLRTFREAGGTIRTYDFQRLVGEVNATRAASGAWIAQPLDTVPGADAFVTHTGSAYSGYEYRVPIFYREPDEGGAVPGHTVFSIRVQEPITPAQAQQMALDYFDEGSDSELYGGQEFLGFGTPGLHQFVR
jgi:hypothetical protein